MLLQFPLRKKGSVIHQPTRPSSRTAEETALRRAANSASLRAVKPAASAVGVAKMASHHSAGMLSRCGHLRAASTPAPISSAIASGDDHRATTARKDEISGVLAIAPSRIGQFVLNGKANLSCDSEGPLGQNPGMDQDHAASAYKQAFISRVKSAREARGLTQTGIATLLGIGQDTYKQYEVRSYLPHYLVPKFCLACGVDASWLFNGPVVVARQRPRTRRQTPPSGKRAIA